LIEIFRNIQKHQQYNSLHISKENNKNNFSFLLRMIKEENIEEEEKNLKFIKEISFEQKLIYASGTGTCKKRKHCKRITAKRKLENQIRILK
jgi:hypothetical protein